ncbi:MAG: hypothetical protein BM556_04915 [Bacteriovorax sp. MedPE-SWde]|nr:MAG: hypothetical protein BM556_04915 [Bacteriovorax sp. MedPE-SWde]
MRENRIKISTPFVELDGDKEDFKNWSLFKNNIICEFLDLDIKYFDISTRNREVTKDKVLGESLESIKKNKLAIKCPTLLETPELTQLKEKTNIFICADDSIKAVSQVWNDLFQAILKDNPSPCLEEFLKSLESAVNSASTIDEILTTLTSQN